MGQARVRGSAGRRGPAVGSAQRRVFRLDGEIVVYASRQLVHTLMEHDLVDEVRLLVFPLVRDAIAETGADEGDC